MNTAQGQDDSDGVGAGCDSGHGLASNERRRRKVTYCAGWMRRCSARLSQEARPAQGTVEYHQLCRGRQGHGFTREVSREPKVEAMVATCRSNLQGLHRLICSTTMSGH